MGGGGQAPPPLRRPGKDAAEVLLPHFPALPSAKAMLAAPYHLRLVTNRFPKLVATAVNEPPSAARRNSRLGAAAVDQEELGWTRTENEQCDFVRRELSLIRSRSLEGGHVAGVTCTRQASSRPEECDRHRRARAPLHARWSRRMPMSCSLLQENRFP